MRIALAQINPDLAGFEKNKTKILDYIARAKEKKADLVIFPESCLFGYHPFDLLERESLVDQQMSCLKEIVKKIPAGITVLIGGFEKCKKKKGRPYYNAAFLCVKNKIVKTFYKELLPTGDVFDEARFIEKGQIKNNFFKIKDRQFFLTICEDIWAWEDSKGKSLYNENPIAKVPRKKVDLVINMSASPFYTKKLKLREYFVQKTAQYFRAPMAYVNMVGAQDEIIYDGQSFVLTPKGEKKLSCLAFAEDLNVFDLDTLQDWNATSRRKRETDTELLRQALVLGIQDFLKKNNLRKVHFGLSGGVDSALLACLAADAIGPQNVQLFALPTQFNQEESFVLAEKLAKNLGIPLKTISIQGMFDYIKTILDSEFSVQRFHLMHENLQSRLRGLILMAYSNLTGSLLLTTGNKSEYATGYATLYGDMCGGLAPLGDLTKKQVYELSKLYNAQTEIIPERILIRPPSAELRPGQKDQDSLPEYDKLDKAVVNIVERKAKLKNATEKWLAEVLMKTEFKRWQAAPILKVSEHSFGRGRRYPLSQSAKTI
ncbi:MAG: NAD(+) synthase [Bdellovibrionales bacterium RIFCSPHIGHO2_01_FULL_40_29]|nr:MAG: NAD(+) synthase [Bdellovibrionales bacterium RIFCSPHIGHO2_01_FULL_40_29]OFZ34738.1 MAG: NAD(+) synthase [Bdellovibrionales bacterium RIFCSPHIGHO2_02_FULL_40_15]